MSQNNLNIPFHNQPNLPFGGRITHFYDNWTKTTQDSWILETVKGDKLEFTQTPHQSFTQKMHTTVEEAALIDLEVQALHLKKAISRVSQQHSCRTNQFVSPMFTVPKKGGGHRPVINKHTAWVCDKQQKIDVRTHPGNSGSTPC
jgi:hypothetical protein